MSVSLLFLQKCNRLYLIQSTHRQQKKTPKAEEQKSLALGSTLWVVFLVDAVVVVVVVVVGVIVVVV